MSRSDHIQIVIEPLVKERRKPKILTSNEAMRVEKLLRFRLRHPRSKIISDQDILRAEERQRNLELARSVLQS